VLLLLLLAQCRACVVLHIGPQLMSQLTSQNLLLLLLLPSAGHAWSCT
jgi:hypothetical protein